MFLNFLHHVQKSPWVIGLVDLGVLDTLKKKKKREIQRPFGLRSRRKGDFGWSKVKASGLHLLWLDVKSVKGRKEGKDEELNREAIRPFGQRWRKRSEVPKVWRLGAVLRSCVSESKQESKRKIERVRENTQWGREQWVKRKRVFFFSQVLSLSVVISI